MTSGVGCQYVKACPIRDSAGRESCDRLEERQGDGLRIRQIWKIHKGGDMDKEGRLQNELTQGELPAELHMGQVVIY